MFVKFDCGCVGMRLEDIDYVITSCDRSCEDIGEYAFYERDMSDKEVVPLSKAERKLLVMNIQRFIFEGQCLGVIRGLLDRPQPLPTLAEIEQQMQKDAL